MEDGPCVGGGDNGGSSIINKCGDVNDVQTGKGFRTDLNENILVFSFLKSRNGPGKHSRIREGVCLVDATGTNWSLFLE